MNEVVLNMNIECIYQFHDDKETVVQLQRMMSVWHRRAEHLSFYMLYA